MERRDISRDLPDEILGWPPATSSVVLRGNNGPVLPLAAILICGGEKKLKQSDILYIFLGFYTQKNWAKKKAKYSPGAKTYPRTINKTNDLFRLSLLRLCTHIFFINIYRSKNVGTSATQLQ